MSGPARVAITGATGFVGSGLVASLRGAGYECLAMGRAELAMAPGALAAHLEGAGAVVNLAGAPILARWTRGYKEELRRSRIGATRRLVEAMGAMSGPRPSVLVSASAIGIYAPGGPHTEARCEYAGGFLGTLARDWEAEALRAGALGIRVVVARLGVVLGPGGGALKTMLPVFRLGLGGTIGDGAQPFSWIHIEDLLAFLRAAIEDPSMSGPYNLTSPGPVTNLGLTRALGRVLHRPTVMRVPGLALRLRYGEGASVLIEGQEALPERLVSSGFGFMYPGLEAALRSLL